MRTTLDIDDGLLMQAKLLAARKHSTLTRVIEESLSLHLRNTQVATSTTVTPVLPVYSGRGGLRPGIRDSRSQRALLDAIDEADSGR